VRRKLAALWLASCALAAPGCGKYGPPVRVSEREKAAQEEAAREAAAKQEAAQPGAPVPQGEEAKP
jgi:hypothetical protein